MRLDWSSDENLVLLNPRLPKSDEAALRGLLETGLKAHALRRHVFILTSGTSASSADPLAGLKWVALSKEAVLNAAESANRHLRSNSKDIWLHCLPDFHVGGLSIWARSALSGARVVKSGCSSSWDPAAFVREAHETGATLCSLVPAQVHDLVRHEFRAPSSLRAIPLGGGASPGRLLSLARDLGWRVLPTYGMTETCSQVATATLDSNYSRDPGPSLEILSHLEVTTDSDQRLLIRGSSLLSGYVRAGENGAVFIDPKQDGWLVTEDFGSVEARLLTVLGRVGDRIKIGGETVHLGRLETLLEEEAARLEIASQLTLVALPDERLETVIHAVCEDHCDPARAQNAISRYNDRVLPFERARAMRNVAAIPRTELGKIRRAELKRLLQTALSPERSP